MSSLDIKLVTIYTIVTIILAIIFLLLSFRMPEKLDTEQNTPTSSPRNQKVKIFPLILLILLLFPIFCIGLFFLNVRLYGFASYVWKEDLLMTQIVANGMNIFLIYTIIQLRRK